MSADKEETKENNQTQTYSYAAIKYHLLIRLVITDRK